MLKHSWGEEVTWRPHKLGTKDDEYPVHNTEKPPDEKDIFSGGGEIMKERTQQENDKISLMSIARPHYMFYSVPHG